MRKFILSALLVIVTLVFTSCSWEKVVEEDRLVKETKEEAEQFFEYLKNEEADNLSSLFCDEKQNEHDLDTEWKHFFDQLNDKFVSYDNIETMVTQRSVYDGKIERLDVSVTFTNIKMKSGKEYRKMGYYKIVKSDVFPEKIGIGTVKLTLSNDDEELKQIGVGSDQK